MVIGRWVYAASQILLLDEPTRGVDIEAKQQIYRIVRRLAAVVLSPVKWRSCRWCVTASCYYSTARSAEFHSPVNVDELMSAILSVH